MLDRDNPPTYQQQVAHLQQGEAPADIEQVLHSKRKFIISTRDYTCQGWI